MYNLQTIREAMEEGIILLDYTSLISGEQKSREVTLHPDYTGGWEVQNKMDNKLLCYDVEFQKWDDIDADTIIKWKKLT